MIIRGCCDQIHQTAYKDGSYEFKFIIKFIRPVLLSKLRAGSVVLFDRVCRMKECTEGKRQGTPRA